MAVHGCAWLHGRMAVHAVHAVHGCMAAWLHARYGQMPMLEETIAIIAPQTTATHRAKRLTRLH
jgi:hypothetical protein